MTDQMFVFLCRDVRKHAFDYRRGDLQDAETRKMDDHLASCEKCRDYLDRLEGMLDSAAVEDHSLDVDRDDMFGRIVEQAREEGISDGLAVDRDSLFDRITAEIDVADTKPAVAAEVLQLANPQETLETERDEAQNRGPIALYVVAALAAGILMGFGLGFLYPANDPTPAPPVVAEKAAPDAAEQQPEPAEVAVRIAELTLQPTPAEFDDVRVFGGPTADWNIRAQGTRRKLELKEGTVLVEFVPEKERQLEFVAEQFTVRVTGTIFYASAEDGIVGVVTGSVEVDHDGGTVKLVDGQEWVMGKGLRQAPAEVRPDTNLLVDVEEHIRALEHARNDAPRNAKRPVRRDAPRPPVSKEVVQTPRDDLRKSADLALREGRYAVAAQYYERMVDELSAADPANASLRLDLARIYIQHLSQERRALVHLRRFVVDRPSDSLTPAARDELCRIAKSVGSVEPQCQP